MLEQLPPGRVLERRLLRSVMGLHELVAHLQRRTFHGLLRLRGQNWEAAFLLEGGDPRSALLETETGIGGGQEAMRRILRAVEEGPTEVEVVELPSSLMPILRQMAEGSLLHRDLSTEFIRLPALSERLEQEGFRGVVVVRGTGWWAFLPFPGTRALYYDREATGEREREELVSEIAHLPAEIDVWAAPEEAVFSWTAFRGDEMFLAAPGLDPAEVAAALGPLGTRVVDLLDGTRDLDAVCRELGQPPATVEPILLHLRRRKWIYRYVRRRRQEA